MYIFIISWKMDCQQRNKKMCNSFISLLPILTDFSAYYHWKRKMSMSTSNMKSTNIFQRNRTIIYERLGFRIQKRCPTVLQNRAPSLF